MADTKISALANATALGGTEQIPGVQSAANVNITPNQIKTHTLTSYAGATSITTLGTVATGTWGATAIGATVGGTAQTTWTTGDTMYASGANTLAKLAAGTNSHVMTMASGIPSWAAPALVQNSQSAAYTTVLADAGKHILHPSADTSARTFTIDANATVAYPIGTTLTFVNQASAGVVTIAITTDTMRLAGAGSTGSRTLAANGIATALKVTSTEWIINGTGLT